MRTTKEGEETNKDKEDSNHYNKVIEIEDRTNRFIKTPVSKDRIIIDKDSIIIDKDSIITDKDSIIKIDNIREIQ